jgi:hypothetical protein
MAAYKSRTRRRKFLAPIVFARPVATTPEARRSRGESCGEPITTEQEAGPDASEAGIEHEG